MPDDLAGTVGVTAGASAPEALVAGGGRPAGPAPRVETVAVTVEDEYFPPPPELRGCCGASRPRWVVNGAPVGSTTGAGPDGGEAGSRVLAEDRETAASDVLERLAG